ncbi:MAG: SgcJ/EcaC family oxidoreductase [bacterium]|nr:SgcJ/EcaC family oxidoreductase [bacterium]
MAALTPQQAQEIGRRYTEAWCSHVPEAVASFYTENGRIVINGGEPAEGREAIADMARGFFNAFPDLIVKMDAIRTSGTHSVYLWTLEGTNTGPDGTGNRVEVSGWEYWHMTEDGLVAESAGHFDAVDYERQIEGR